MGMRREEFVGSTGPALKPSGSPTLLHQADPSGLLCVDIFMSAHVLARPVGPMIVMATHNNKDILMVPYEDLPDENKVSSVKL